MNTRSKPKVFIASSVEGLNIADAINANLEYEAECTIWRAGTFKLSSQTLDDLVRKSSTVDFAVFVFTPDDAATIREHVQAVARDNVVFETGLFVGAIGKERCYIVKPRNVDMHLPSDVLGVTPADYEPNRSDGDVESALNYACKLVKDRIRELGPIDRSPQAGPTAAGRHVANPPNYALQDSDLMFLAECVRSHVSQPVGRSFSEITNAVVGHSDQALTVSAIKLDRLGYVAKSVEQGYNGDYEYFAYTATQSGLDAFLKNEPRFSELQASVPRSRKAVPKKPATGFDDIDDQIPF